jgi:hypothetical protein
MNIVENNYSAKCSTPSDIYEHLPTLASYAEKCEVVTEFGMRGVVSTWALLKGLLANSSTKKKLISADLNYAPTIEEIVRICPELNVDFYFIMGNDIKINIEQTDLLFIDTWHIYGHLKRELETFHSKVNKYIILHDTTVDGEIGETIRNQWDPVAQAKQTGYPIEEITKGLWPAVEEFLISHPEWKLEHRYTNNNGLTILSRTS